MNSNIKKLMIALAAIVIVALAIFAMPGMTATEGTKQITLIVENDVTGEVLVDEKVFKTDAETLGDFLEEYQEELNVKMEDSQYGRVLNGLMNLEPESMEAGPWWMYGYSSPAQDLELAVGLAPGIDEVMLQDQDIVHFIFTTNMGF